MKKIKRLISIITALSIISVFSLNISAITPDLALNKLEVKFDSSDYTLNNLPSYVLETIQSNNKEVESLDLENIEDEFSIITNNKDGSKTHYKFETPIKFKNENKISFRNPQIEKSDLLKRIFTKHTYESVENNFKSYFPQKLQDGILMEYQDYSIEIASISNPEYSSNDMTVSTQENKVKYSNVFTSKDHVEYIPIVNGLKENIVLHEYTGENTFNFKLNIGGLTPAFMEGESIPLLDQLSNELVMAIGQVDAKDSYVGENENNDMHFSLYNELKLEKTETDNEYILTVVVDKEFLESETTVYPVVIDPTINITDTSRMRDTTVYSAKPTSQTFYTSSYNNVGNHGASYGQGIAFIQVLTMHSYKQINPNNITSAYYHVREGSGKTNSSVIEVHDTYLNWDENTITYNNMPGTYNYDSSKNVTVTTSKWYDFYITGLVQAWLKTELNEGGWNQTYGFALKAQNSSASSKHFCSANNSSYPPSMIVNYNEDSSLASGTYFIGNIWQGKYFDSVMPEAGYTAGRTNAWGFHGETNQQWKVAKNNDGTYGLSPVSRPGFYMEVYQQIDTDTQPVTTYSHNPTVSAAKWRIIKNADGTYRIMPAFSNTRSLDVYGGTNSTMVFSGRSFPKRNGTDMQICTYGARRNQKWVFETVTTGTGAAWAYNSKNNGYATSYPDNPFVNCYLYALGLSTKINGDDGITGYYGSDAVSVMTNRVLSHVRSLGRRIDVISSATTAIPADRYRFCMRISFSIPDYHYWVQSSNKGWVDKQGWFNAASIKGYVNPTTANSLWGKYTSATVYFASTYN